jgi:hypothetical protein
MEKAGDRFHFLQYTREGTAKTGIEEPPSLQ